MNETTLLVLLVTALVVAVIIGGAVLATRRARRRSVELHRHFGPEYDVAVEELGVGEGFVGAIAIRTWRLVVGDERFEGGLPGGALGVLGMMPAHHLRALEPRLPVGGVLLERVLVLLDRFDVPLRVAAHVGFVADRVDDVGAPSTEDAGSRELRTREE